MKKLSLLIFSCCLSLSIGAHGWPANYGGVMLQGFSWDSFIDTQWTNLEAQSDELAEYFDLIWVPQSGNCNSSYNVMGYTPVYWYDHNSSFGTEAQLRSFIKTCKEKGVGVIADVVINHRGSLGVNGSWVDFPAETYQGKTWQLGLADICIDDDGGATAKKYAVSGAKDTGEDWSGMRDLDHTSANVQANVINYLNFLKEDLGYVGFRYDMTKGYAAKYTGLYNATVKPTYSVGEYWDGSVNLLMTWIAGTKVDDEIQSATFDFATRYVLRDACAAANWSKLATRAWRLMTTTSVMLLPSWRTMTRSIALLRSPVILSTTSSRWPMLISSPHRACPASSCLIGRATRRSSNNLSWLARWQASIVRARCSSSAAPLRSMSSR